MRGTAMASLFVLATISAVSGTVAAYATWGKGASACEIDSSADEKDSKAVFQDVVLRHRTRRLLP